MFRHYKLPMALALLATLGSTASAQKSLPRATAETQGVSTKQVLEFVRVADEQVDSIHSLMILRHGKVVTEVWWSPESANKPHILWSLSKSFTSTAVGFAVQEGKLDVYDKVLGFFSEHEFEKSPSKNLKAMRVIDLLTMTCGHQHEVHLNSEVKNWAEAFLNHPVPHLPGTHFKYNTPGSYMLSRIVQEATGEKVVEYLQPRLFDPLGIKPPRWDACPQGVSLGGYGLYLRTEDIAKFGQLYLQKGRWHDKLILPQEWIEKATAKQVSNGNDPDNDWNQGYGFQFWRCTHGAYRGDGRDGQFCIVFPEQDAVIAITSKTRNMGGELKLVWEKLLPAFHEEPLPEDLKSQRELERFAEQLKATR